MKRLIIACILMSIPSLIISADGAKKSIWSYRFVGFIKRCEWEKIQCNESNLKRLSKNELDEIIMCCKQHEDEALRLRMMHDDPDVKGIKKEFDYLKNELDTDRTNAKNSVEVNVSESTLVLKFIAKKRLEKVARSRQRVVSRALDVLETSHIVKDSHSEHMEGAIKIFKNSEVTFEILAEQISAAKQLANHCEALKATKK